MIERLRPESSAPPKQRRRGRSGWPLAEADKSAGIPEADRHAIQLAIAEWAVAPKDPRRRRTKLLANAGIAAYLAAGIGPGAPPLSPPAPVMKSPSRLRTTRASALRMLSAKKGGRRSTV
jgi:hypothetical protein